MVDIVGYNKKKSKEGKTFVVLYYKSDKKITDGNAYGSVIASDEYAKKLIQHAALGGQLGKGWSKKEKREFLYIPKE